MRHGHDHHDRNQPDEAVGRHQRHRRGGRQDRRQARPEAVRQAPGPLGDDQHRQREHGQRDGDRERRRPERVEVRRPQRLEDPDRVAERDDDQDRRDDAPRRDQPAQHPLVGRRQGDIAGTGRIDDDVAQREAAHGDRQPQHQERQAHVGDHGEEAGHRWAEHEPGEVGGVEHAEAFAEVAVRCDHDRPPGGWDDHPDTGPEHGPGGDELPQLGRRGEPQQPDGRHRHADAEQHESVPPVGVAGQAELGGQRGGEGRAGDEAEAARREAVAVLELGEEDEDGAGASHDDRRDDVQPPHGSSVAGAAVPSGVGQDGNGRSRTIAHSGGMSATMSRGSADAGCQARGSRSGTSVASGLATKR
jgi:hypothetical protein